MKRLIVLSTLGLCCQFAYAQPASQEVVADDNWTVTLGVGAAYGPRYLGSESSKVSGAGEFRIDHSSGFFLSLGEGLGYQWHGQHGTLAASINASGSRDEKDGGDQGRNPLIGMGKIKSGAQANFMASTELAGITLSLLSSHGLEKDNEGALVTLGASIPVLQHASGLSVSLDASAEAADQKYLQRWFGVTAAQSAKSGNKQFKPEAGFSMVSAGVSVFMPLSKEVSWVTSVGHQQLQGDAANSPLVRSKGGAVASTMLLYTW